MERPLPETMVAALNELAESLTTGCGEGRDGPLAEHAAAVLERVLGGLPRRCQAVVEVATSGLDPRLARARSAWPRCERQGPPQQVRRRQVTTHCGLMTVEAPWSTGERCGPGGRVLESTLGVAPRQRLRAGLRAWLVR
jgi:hypothetical protein